MSLTANCDWADTLGTTICRLNVVNQLTMPPRIAMLAFSAVLTGCFSGDAPLLCTDLPNGYTFESNGGGNGFIRGPNGLWLAEHFGIQSDGSEHWCTEFGWQNAVVVCRLSDEANLPVVRDLGYLVLDTESGSVSVLSSSEEAIRHLSTLSLDSLPSMATHYASTKRL